MLWGGEDEEMTELPYDPHTHAKHPLLFPSKPLPWRNPHSLFHSSLSYPLAFSSPYPSYLSLHSLFHPPLSHLLPSPSLPPSLSPSTCPSLNSKLS